MEKNIWFQTSNQFHDTLSILSQELGLLFLTSRHVWKVMIVMFFTASGPNIWDHLGMGETQYL